VSYLECPPFSLCCRLTYAWRHSGLDVRAARIICSVFGACYYSWLLINECVSVHKNQQHCIRVVTMNTRKAALSANRLSVTCEWQLLPKVINILRCITSGTVLPENDWCVCCWCKINNNFFYKTRTSGGDDRFALVLCKVHFHYTLYKFFLATSQCRDVRN